MESHLIFVVSLQTPLRSSALIPLLSTDCPFLDCHNNQFFYGTFWDMIVLFMVFNIFIIVGMVAIVLKSSVVVLLILCIVPT